MPTSSARLTETMTGVFLPGQRRVELRDVPVPEPGPGQVLVRMRASAICGSDLRAIYREHLGTGPEAYRGVVAGHEPAGEVVEAGPGCRRFAAGDRVAVYHIAGCGLCEECRLGYLIGCTSPLRAAYGWQRDGGHAEYLLADEATCVALPDSLSYLDGACVACGFGTVYEALRRADVSGRDRVLVVGMGPMGLAAGLLAKALGAPLTVGADVVESRLDLGRRLGAIDAAVPADDHAAAAVRGLTDGGCEVSIDCSGSTAGRLVALEGARRWGRCVLVGEGNRLDVDVSRVLIHRQLTVLGTWVTSVWRMEELVERLARWDLHPERTVTSRFALADAAEAYRVADEGLGGKVALVTDG
jgi:threonine dehydrogenase-like Zn-dependent dehydrogenase